MSLVAQPAITPEHQSFEAVYRTYAPVLLRYLERRLPDSQAALDVWSESWAIAFAHTAGPRRLAPCPSWVFGIARRLTADWYRYRGIERRALARLGCQAPVAPEDWPDRVGELDASEPVRRAIEASMARLPAKLRDALELRIVHELEYEHIAALLGCKEDAARARVSRGLRRLRPEVVAHYQPRPTRCHE